MNPIVFYQALYESLDRTSPLGFDCGRLCGAACCRVSPELPGMYLFPGEEALFSSLPGFTVSQANLPGYGPVRLLGCSGTCDRAARPLSCRVFPLAPSVRGEIAGVRLDPRGRPVCPLCHKSKAALSGNFVSGVEAVFAILLTELSTSGFVTALSRYLDEFEKPLF